MLAFGLSTQRFFEILLDSERKVCDSLPVANDGDTIKQNIMENIITQDQSAQVRKALIGAMVALETDIVFLQKDFSYITQNRKEELEKVKQALNLMVFQLAFLPQEVSKTHAIVAHSRAKADLFAE